MSSLASSLKVSREKTVPVGSALVGSEDFIQESRRFRKQFGGSMRQAGIIASAALHALENHRERLTEDHQNAKDLALGLVEIPGILIDPVEVETNIVYFGVKGLEASVFQQKLEEHNVRLLTSWKDTIRAVTNLMVNSKQIRETLQAVRMVMREA